MFLQSGITVMTSSSDIAVAEGEVEDLLEVELRIYEYDPSRSV